MQFHPITLTDQSLFKRYLSYQEQRLISYNFSNFYIWRNWDPYSWAEVADCLVVKSGYHHLDTICVPLGALPQNILAATEMMIKEYAARQQEFIISEVSEAALALYQKHWPNRFSVEEYLPGANYIYLQKDLAHLAGKRYNAKRNHINRFLRSYPDHCFRPFGEEVVAGCKEQVHQWFALHDLDNPDLRSEYEGCLDALDNYQALGCDGAALLIKDHVVAFALGDALSRDTYAIHIEKADIDIHGAYQMINRYFANEYASGYTYINRAEDMGEPGLQRAKESYYPCHMEKKYYLRLADD